MYYASQVTEGNKRTTLNERFGEQEQEDTTATESDRYAPVNVAINISYLVPIWMTAILPSERSLVMVLP